MPESAGNARDGFFPEQKVSIFNVKFDHISYSRLSEGKMTNLEMSLQTINGFAFTVPFYGPWTFIVVLEPVG